MTCLGLLQFAMTTHVPPTSVTARSAATRQSRSAGWIALGVTGNPTVYFLAFYKHPAFSYLTSKFRPGQTRIFMKYPFRPLKTISTWEKPGGSPALCRQVLGGRRDGAHTTFGKKRHRTRHVGGGCHQNKPVPADNLLHQSRFILYSRIHVNRS